MVGCLVGCLVVARLSGLDDQSLRCVVVVGCWVECSIVARLTV